MSYIKENLHNRDTLLTFEDDTFLSSQQVRWMALGDLASFKNGKGHEQSIDASGLYIVVNSKFVSTDGKVKKYSAKQFSPVSKDDVLMVMSDLPNGRALAKCFLVDENDRYTLNQRICALSVKDTSEVLVKFFYFVLSRNKQLLKFDNGVDQTNLRKEDILKIKLPIPSLSIQQKIVRILDNFMELEIDLERSLGTELEARRKQYQYYRNALLTFKDKTAREMTLGDLGKISMCKRIFKHETTTKGRIPFYKIGTFGSLADAFISQDLYEDYRRKYSFPKKGDVLISASGTIGRTLVYDGNAAYFQDSNIVWIDNDESQVLNSFLYYLYQVINWETNGATIQRLYNENIRRTKIIVPSIEVQKRIVSILDKFDTLVNDLSEGLPAEIKARRQQYEHYRDQLLSFKEFV